MPRSRSTALPRHQKKERWRTNNETKNAAYESTNATYKEELQQMNRLGTVCRKSTDGLKQVILVLNLTLNSDAVPNYKYMFGAHRSPLPHLWNITVKKYNQNHHDKTKQRAQWRSEARIQEHRHWWALVRCQPSETVLGGSHHLVSGSTHRCAVKVRSKVINQGPVVQSVVSLTSSLRVISLTVLVDSIHNILIFLLKKCD